MIKANRRLLWITSFLILLPIAAGLILWPALPSRIATHFGVNNEPNGWSGKPFAVVGLPCIMLGLHWAAVAALELDGKKRNIDGKMMTVILWICPTLSLSLSTMTYTHALGVSVNIGFYVMLLMGVLLLAIGNSLPKCRQNHTVGVRLPWTLQDPENWRRTHRVAGWSMSVAGLLILATAYLCVPWLFFGILTLAILLPVIYSFLYHRAHAGR